MSLAERIKDSFYVVSRVRNWREALKSEGNYQFATWKLRNGSSFRAESGTGDIYVAHEVILRDVYPLRSSYGLVVDIGAHIGTFVARVSPLAERVVAFEPVSRNFNLLRDYCQTAKNNVEKHKLAVTADGRIATINISGKTSRHSIYELDEAALEHENVPSVASRDLLKFLGSDSIDLLKMDVEGAEYEILESARELLRSTNEILLEAHSINRFRPSAAESLLKEAGFTVVRVQGDDETCVYHATKL